MTTTTTTNGELATFEQLIASSGKRRFDVVTAPVCGLRFRMRSLTEREVSNYQAVVQSARDDQSRQVRLSAANRRFLALCLVDDVGNPIVPADQVGKLAELDAADSAFLYDQCVRHSGITAQDLQDLVGNFDETTPSDSPTNSPIPAESST